MLGFPMNPKDPERSLQVPGGSLAGHPGDLYRSPANPSEIPGGPWRILEGSLRILFIHWRTKHVVNLILKINVAETLVLEMF